MERPSRLVFALELLELLLAIGALHDEAELVAAAHERDEILDGKFDEHRAVGGDDEIEHGRGEGVVLVERLLNGRLRFGRGEVLHEGKLGEDLSADVDALVRRAADNFSICRIQQSWEWIEHEFPAVGEGGEAREDDEKIDDAGLKSGRSRDVSRDVEARKSELTRSSRADGNAAHLTSCA